MRHCVFCDTPLKVEGGRGSRQAYDPELGRLWDVCPACSRWTPVPLALRWETLEEWEERVRVEGRVILASDELALIGVRDAEVVRVGAPSLVEWGGWRYGSRMAPRGGRSGFLQRILASLPPAPIEGYDPYGLSGPLGGVGARNGPSQWLASPFIERAQPLTIGFASVPFAPSCPSCGIPMPLQPWDFADVSFHITGGRCEVEATCGHCRTIVSLPLSTARAALRFGLGILDSDPKARTLGEDAGRVLRESGGGDSYLRRLSHARVSLGGLERTERVALGIGLDLRAEAEALEAEWKEAEEIAAIMDGELTRVPGFREFRERVLGGDA